jgi:hypothetical protein
MDIDEDTGSYAGSSSGRRRSSRSTVVNARKHASEGINGRNDGYHGERRSTRLGNAPAIAFDESEQALLTQKRATSNLSDSTGASPAPLGASTSEPPVLVTVPPPHGKKKSRFWYYAVEPGLDSSVSAEATPTPPTGPPRGETNGNSTTPSEAGASLIDAMDGVELTDAKHSIQQLTNGASTNGSGNHGMNGDSKRGTSPESDMSISDGDS